MPRWTVNVTVDFTNVLWYNLLASCLFQTVTRAK
uniref:Uncharacterized protein n=1 Tax=Arundo donax TaxID=35708 RepID=A0A0A8Y8T1_ARUDO